MRRCGKRSRAARGALLRVAAAAPVALLSLAPGWLAAPSQARISASAAAPAGGAVPADLTSKALVTVTTVDTGGRPLAHVPVELVCNGHAVVSPATAATGSDGAAPFAVTDGVPGTVTCLAYADTPPDANVPGIVAHHRLDQSVAIRFTALTGRTADPLDTRRSAVSVSPTTLRADLVAKATVEIRLEDGAGKAMAGVPVGLACLQTAGAGGATAGHPLVGPPAATSDASGSARFTVADGVPGTVTCLASADTPPDPNVPGILARHRLDRSATIRFTALTGRKADPLDTAASKASAAPATARADLVDRSAVTVTLVDTKGRPVAGAPVSLACLQSAGQGGGSSSHAVVTPAVATSGGTGTARFEITDGVPGTVTCLVYAETPPDPNVPGLLDRHRLDGSVTVRFAALTGRTAPALDTRRSTVVLAGGAGEAPQPAAKGGAGWDATAAEWRGRTGRSFAYSCPPGGTRNEAWGSGPYSDQSSVCTAAVNYGLITVAGGGTVTIQIAPGRDSYAGSSRNGTTTRDLGRWYGSFVFAGPPKVASDAGYGGDGWGNGAAGFRGQTGMRLVFSCPPNPRIDPSKAGNVYGTDTYMDTSPVCVAAVHAGVVTASGGGDVTVRLAAGLASYAGTTRNGVTSQSWGRWPGSYVFVRG